MTATTDYYRIDPRVEEMKMDELFREFIDSFRALQRKMYPHFEVTAVAEDGSPAIKQIHRCKVCNVSTLEKTIPHRKGCELARMEAIKRQIKERAPHLFGKRPQPQPSPLVNLLGEGSALLNHLWSDDQVADLKARGVITETAPATVAVSDEDLFF